MKVNCFILSILICISISCKKEVVRDESRGITNSDSKVDDNFDYVKSKSYTNFVKNLEDQYGKDHKIYHMQNLDKYSDSVKSVISKLYPEILDTISVVNSKSGLTTQSTIYTPFGPYPYSTSGGNAFDARMLIYSGETSKRLKGIKIRCGSWIDAIQLWWVNNLNQTSISPQFGKNGGREYYIMLNTNEYIVSITVRSGSWVDYLQFNTNVNVYTFGNPDGGNQTFVNFAQGDLQCHGIFGRSGAWLDQIGFYGYPSSMFTNIQF